MRSLLLFWCLLSLSAGVAVAHGNLAPPPPPLYTPAHTYPTLYYPQPHYTYQYGSQDSNTGFVKNRERPFNGDKVFGVYVIRAADGTTQEVHYLRGGHKDVKKTSNPGPNLFLPNGVITREDY